MKKNMGGADRGIRVVVAIAAAALYFSGTVTGVWGILLLLVAGVFTFTSIFGVCPLYSIIGVSTCAVKTKS